MGRAWVHTDSAIQEAIMFLAKVDCRFRVLEVGSRDDELFTAYILCALEDGVEV